MNGYKIVEKWYEPKSMQFYLQLENEEKESTFNLIIDKATVDDIFLDDSCRDLEEAIKILVECLEKDKLKDGTILLDHLVQEALNNKEVKSQLEERRIANFSVSHPHFKNYISRDGRWKGYT